MRVLFNCFQCLSARIPSSLRLTKTISRLMSKDTTTTHLDRTVSKPRESVTAVGSIIQKTQLSKTVTGISILVPNDEFKFKAGQWVDFFIPGIEVVGGFSMISCPMKLEKHRVIDLAVKQSDHPPANWVCTKSKIGDKVSMKVGGNFIFEPFGIENVKGMLFIAGGVGINPLYSMIQEVKASLDGGLLFRETRVQLLFSASSVDELIFKDELLSIAKETENINCSFYVTRGDPKRNMENGKYEARFGRITDEILQENLKNFNVDTTIVYVCGPPPMIEFVVTALVKAGLRDCHIKREQWW